MLLALSLFFAEPSPLDMPRARSYLVNENGSFRLEDRYRKLDLWTAAAVSGRWYDVDGREFTLVKLVDAPPATGFDEYLTRREYESERVRLDRKDVKRLADAVRIVSPVPTSAEPVKARRLPHGYARLEYWQGTNSSALVAAFLPERSETWYVAAWLLAAGDDVAEMAGVFEDRFLRADLAEARKERAMDWRHPRADRRGKRAGHEKIPPERELFRRDALHSVSNYPSWRFTDSPEFIILDALGKSSGFPAMITNDMPALRKRFAEVVPPAASATNSLSVARIYASRDDYLAAVGADMAWSAAYWSSERRELVAYLGEGAEAQLASTFRHEAFHQYLAYASSMIVASPWFNEGYAQYFEYEERMPAWAGGFLAGEEELDAAAASLPALMSMGYESFYAGTDAERAYKYRLAWMTAYFIEKGACEVRHDPFRNLKRDYMASLVENRDMHRATADAFGSDDQAGLFIAEWRKFWAER